MHMFDADVAHNQRQKPNARLDVLHAGELFIDKTVSPSQRYVLQREPDPWKQLGIDPSANLQRASGLIEYKLLNAVFVFGGINRTDNKRCCYEQGCHHGNQS